MELTAVDTGSLRGDLEQLAVNLLRHFHTAAGWAAAAGHLRLRQRLGAAGRVLGGRERGARTPGRADLRAGDRARRDGRGIPARHRHRGGLRRRGDQLALRAARGPHRRRGGAPGARRAPGRRWCWAESPAKGRGRRLRVRLWGRDGRATRSTTARSWTACVTRPRPTPTTRWPSAGCAGSRTACPASPRSSPRAAATAGRRTSPAARSPAWSPRAPTSGPSRSPATTTPGTWPCRTCSRTAPASRGRGRRRARCCRAGSTCWSAATAGCGPCGASSCGTSRTCSAAWCSSTWTGPAPCCAPRPTTTRRRSRGGGAARTGRTTPGCAGS